MKVNFFHQKAQSKLSVNLNFIKILFEGFLSVACTAQIQHELK